LNSFKDLVKKYFTSFVFFYRYLRYRVLIAVFFNIVVGVLDGFGLAMFLPLLQMAGGEGSMNAESMGNLSFIVDAMNGLGVSLTLVSVLMVMILFFSLKGVFTYFTDVYKLIIQQLFIKTIRVNLLNDFNQISFEKYVISDVGRIQNTMSGEVERVARAYDSYFLAMQFLILAMVYMGFAYYLDPVFAIMVSVGGLGTNLLFGAIYKITKKASLKFTMDSNVYQGEIIQHVGNFKYLKATGRVNVFGDKLKRTIDSIEHSRLRIGYMGSIVRALREPVLVLIVAIVLLVQTRLLGSPIGPIIISLLFFYRALNSVMGMQTAWNYFLGNSGSIQNLIEFQGELKDQVEIKGTQTFNGFKNKLELTQVGFSYNGQKKVLNQVNLEIKKNQTIAFVGESGSGKTTLVNLIAGLLKPVSGTYLIDGSDINKLQIESFQNRIGYITQEPVVFTDTIYNNISLWEGNSPEMKERFFKAIKLGSIEDFIEGLPKKELTELGSNGVNLSGGQKQRIAIARELYKETDILILDEATSALDSETERVIKENIDQLKGRYTLLMVAHRLSTIRNSDMVVFMNEGQIECTGTFDELVNKSPKFKKMVELQEI
jgi:ABC-type multidrug transport system fused ATPase/permease subunit